MKIEEQKIDIYDNTQNFNPEEKQSENNEPKISLRNPLVSPQMNLQNIKRALSQWMEEHHKIPTVETREKIDMLRKELNKFEFEANKETERQTNELVNLKQKEIDLMQREQELKQKEIEFRETQIEKKKK